MSILYPKRRQFFVPYNGKIADITHADTSKHTLDLATALSETRKIIAISVRVERQAGTGNLPFFPNEGTTSTGYSNNFLMSPVIIKDDTQRLQYSLTVANDDFDLVCLGYVVET